MSMREIGEPLKITPQQVQKYEIGTNRIGASRLQQFATVLGVPVAFFFEGAPRVSSQVVASDVEGGHLADFLSTPEGVQLTQGPPPVHLPCEGDDGRRKRMTSGALVGTNCTSQC
jgi:transcriptional regulator with XRE-family HTH domain